MAAGDAVVEVLREMPPASAYAQLDARAGGSSPAESYPVWDFDANLTEYLDLLCRLQGYDGGGLTFLVAFAMTSASAGDVRVGLAVRALPAGGEDLAAAHAYDFNEATVAVPASGRLAHVQIPFTHGADMDGWADGQLAVVRFRRNAGDGADTALGDLELFGVAGVEG